MSELSIHLGSHAAVEAAWARAVEARAAAAAAEAREAQWVEARAVAAEVAVRAAESEAPRLI